MRVVEHFPLFLWCTSSQKQAYEMTPGLCKSFASTSMVVDVVFRISLP